MIDTHCHLEQNDYDMDRYLVIGRCRKYLQAIITSCTNPAFFNITVHLTGRYRNFVFAAASIHPIYVKDFSREEIEKYIDLIRSSRDALVAIGETGLDYSWVKESEWQSKQKELFQRFIDLAEELHLPLVIHSRDSTQNVMDILEENEAKQVHLHMFTDHSSLKRVLDNNWMISVNTLLLRSKNVKKIVRDCPLEHIMLETDSPWLGLGEDGNIKPKDKVRNEPTAVKFVVERIAEIKKVEELEVDLQTTNNATKFFNLTC